MKKFMLLHIGFETPTPELMQAWGTWFQGVAPVTVEHGGLLGGREISKEGTRELAMDRNAITGYSIIRAESLDEAEKIASTNPFVTSIRICEIRAH